MSTITSSTTLTMRLATAADAPRIALLAELDSAEAPGGDLLLALVDDRPMAALSLETGAVVADPFVHTADLVALLRERAAGMRAHDTRPVRRAAVAGRLKAARGWRTFIR